MKFKIATNSYVNDEPTIVNVEADGAELVDNGYLRLFKEAGGKQTIVATFAAGNWAYIVEENT